MALMTLEGTLLERNVRCVVRTSVVSWSGLMVISPCALRALVVIGVLGNDVVGLGLLRLGFVRSSSCVANCRPACPPCSGG